MRYIFLLLLLSGCKASQTSFMELKTICPSQGYTTYVFGKYPNRLILLDTAGAYEFPDTIYIKHSKK